MKVAAFTEHGGPEVLRLMRLPTPQAGEGQLRIQVRTAGVQPYDCAVRGGRMPPGGPVAQPTVPGNEFAGVVDQVGAGVSGFGLGDEVLGFGRLHAYAEYLLVGPEQVTAKPAAMRWEVAGGFTAGAQTAHIALQTLGVGRDETVLIHAAAGGVGTIAVQLARLWGATVIGTASERNHDYLRSLGAIPVAYGDGLLQRVRALAPSGVDAALDGAGGEALEVSLQVVADRGRIVTLVEHARAAELGIRVTENLRSAARLAELAELQAAGELRVHIREVYPLERAADAHRAVESRHGAGKIVLAVG